MTVDEMNVDSSFSEKFNKSLYELTDGERTRMCIQCGTCSGICPFGYWMDFPPRRILAFMQRHMMAEVMQSDAMWMCVSCYACTQVCPQQIPLTAALMTRAKEGLILAGNVPPELQSALENSQRYGNPLGAAPRMRANWVKGLDPPVVIMRRARRPVDLLWFVGDYAAYHPRGQAAARALVRLLRLLDVDFGILGAEEVSDGDSQRLAGESALFEMLAEKNGRAFSKYQFKQIVTTDPHAYNALKNEYPRLGISYPVLHYTQFLAERLEQIRPLLTREIRALVAYHDPCYLGRVNNIYDEPRALLAAVPGVMLVEMAHHRANSLCCGGGGGGMWLDGFRWEKSQNRLPEWRVREAMQAAPRQQFSKRKAYRQEPHPKDRILAVACPYEAPRFEDAAKAVPEAQNLRVLDIAELLVEAIAND